MIMQLNIVDPIVEKIAQANTRKDLLLIIKVLLKKKSHQSYLRTALNKLYAMVR
jgi:hypothetical protein